MPTDDREQQFERALARRLRDASPDSQCPDAETLAAYHERTLPLDQMALWKEHITGCARCQETLALVERSEDVQSEFVHSEDWKDQGVLAGKFGALASAVPRAAAPRMPPSEIGVAATPAIEPGTLPMVRRRPPWRWIVPLGTVAACVIVWIGVREIRTQHHNQALVAQSMRREENLPPLSLPVVPSGGTQDQLKNERTPAPTPDKSVRDHKLAESAGAAPSIATGAGAGLATINGAISSSVDSKRFAAPNKQAASSARAAAAPRNPTSSASDAIKSTTSEQVQVTEALPAPPPAASGNPAAPTPGAAQKELVPPPPSTQAITVNPQPVEVGANAVSSALATQAFKGLNLSAVAAADHRYIVAPHEKSAWRVGAGGKIERSTDHGKTWKTQQSGVTVDLTSGSALSDRICWVVGKSGTILLSTDGGKHWKQILSPIDGDLGGIHAIDALNASVWDVANRTSYQTSDGGETWSRIANE